MTPHLTRVQFHLSLETVSPVTGSGQRKSAHYPQETNVIRRNHVHHRISLLLISTYFYQVSATFLVHQSLTYWLEVKKTPWKQSKETFASSISHFYSKHQCLLSAKFFCLTGFILSQSFRVDASLMWTSIMTRWTQPYVGNITGFQIYWKTKKTKKKTRMQHHDS